MTVLILSKKTSFTGGAERKKMTEENRKATYKKKN